ncbi:MAG: chorismate synthase [Bacteroidales bacterium]|nr:chorismate synthase [Bacteroidales bacterium]
MNSFGQLFRLTDFGDTHGPSMGGIIDGCPAGLAIDMAFVQSELDRRAPVSGGPLVTDRLEEDRVDFVSGIYEGVSTGAPIAFIISNRDGRPNLETNNILKPSHASFVLREKYGHHCNEQGGRSSARQTVNRVVGGAVAKLLLATCGIRIEAHTLSVAQISREGDTGGALVQGCIHGAPAGLGEPSYHGFDARLAAAMLSIPACKGFEIGEGFRAADSCGYEYNDRQYPDFSFRTNHDGGVQAGISNGQDITFRVAFKPIPTVRIPQETIDYEGNVVSYCGNARNDVSVVPRVLPVVEAMAALVTADLILLNRSSRL